MKRWLVFGLSGQVGAALQAALTGSAVELVAVSRQPRPRVPGVTWLQAALAPGLDPGRDFDALLSLGPLDAFVDWFEGSALAPSRVVALGSTSVHSKVDSPDPEERALASRLKQCEARLAAACASRGSALALLRPTLIYGGGERSLSRIVALARRWRWLPLPSSACGLRQPVHAGDLATAVLACLESPLPIAGSYDLPGGETLAYDEMIRRVLAAAVPGARLLRLPGPLFRIVVRGLRALGLRGAGDAATGDSGVTARLFGSFLSWLNDHTSDVFVIATCNNLAALPPEFTRAERFDGIFFLDLPTALEREQIWEISRQEFGLASPEQRPLDTHWTGAEIKACCRLAALLDLPLLDAAKLIVPIATTAAESIGALRAWAQGRCLSAQQPGLYQIPKEFQSSPGRRLTGRASSN